MSQLVQSEPSASPHTFSKAKPHSAVGLFERWQSFLWKPIDGASIALFRICFGLLMLIEVLRYVLFGWVREYYIEPEFVFSYISFVRPWNGVGMYAHFAGLGLLSILIAIGLYYRAAITLFFFGYTYVFLLDKAHYLNHFYLICLLSFLLALVPAHHNWSFDRLRVGSRLPSAVPNWCWLILRAQLVLVYFYAGIAKLNVDWLHGEPPRTWLAARADLPVFGPLLASEWAVACVTYGGILIDLSVGFLLLYRRTFWVGAIAATLFHLTNAYLFTIGIFPILMLATLVLFPRPDWPRDWVRQFKESTARLRTKYGVHASACPRAFKKAGAPRQINPCPAMSRVPASAGLASARPRMLARSTRSRVKAKLHTCHNGLAIVVLHVYFVLQILVPLRHWLYPGSVHWTEEGHRFSWHMMLRDKDADLALFAIDERAGRHQHVKLDQILTPRQLRKMSTRPDMIQQIAHYVADRYQSTNGTRPSVRVFVTATLNARPPQYLIDPKVNLAAQPFTWRTKPWIVPLQPRASERR